MRILTRFLSILYTIYAAVVFIALMLPVFLWTFLVLPFGKVRSGNLIYRACMLWGDIWFLLIFVRHKNKYEQALNKNESYIFVSNHISYFDVPTIVKTFRQPVRPLGKVEITRVPIFGLIYKKTIVTVERSSAPNRARSVQELKAVLQQGISILVFPEGTFNETGKPLKDFYDGAFRIAIETATPIVPVLMLDTYDRLHYRSIFSLTPGKNRSVFLPKISTAGFGTEDVPFLKEKVYSVMEEGLRRYHASWIKD